MGGGEEPARGVGVRARVCVPVHRSCAAADAQLQEVSGRARVLVSPGSGDDVWKSGVSNGWNV